MAGCCWAEAGCDVKANDMNSHELLPFVTQGSGPALVLLHGFANDHRAWAGQIAALSRHMQVVAPDLGGFGSWPRIRRDKPSIAQYALDVLALLDHLGIRRATILGLSMGGYVALELATRHPQRVQALILANTRATADAPHARKARLELAQAIEQRGIDAVVDAFAGRLLREGALPERQDRVRDMLERQSPLASVAALHAMAARPDMRARLSTIAVPTLVITSDADRVIAPEETLAMAERIARAQRVVIHDAGHLSNIDRPELFNQAVFDFLSPMLG